MYTAWRSAPTVFGSPISDVNDVLDANESTRVFVALGDCSMGSICVERIERERHLARPVGEYRSVGEKPCGTTSAGTPKGGTRERVWPVEALPKTHENLTGGATFLEVGWVGGWRGDAVAFRFQSPPVEPCVRFSRTRLTDALHRRCSVSPARPGGAWVQRRFR